MIANLFHVVLGIAGLLLLYAGLFLTETEEGRLQNRLQELWVRIDDLHSGAMTRQAVLLQQIAGLVAGGFATLFGRKFFSLKSVASCLCFSLASSLSLAMFVREVPLLSKTVFLVCSLIFLVCGLSRRFRYLGFVTLAVAGVLELLSLRGHAIASAAKRASFQRATRNYSGPAAVPGAG